MASAHIDTQEGLQGNPRAISVTDALLLAKSKLEDINITILGEVSEVNKKAGYKAVYFTVKDDKSSLPCLMWLNRYKLLDFELEVGALVELRGHFSLFAAKGRMNFDVVSLSLAGEGNLRLQVANLAKKLASEGLMDASVKRPIPTYPLKVGIVTSPRGAVIHDMLRTLRRRFPLACVYVAGVAVEGKDAPRKMIEALMCLEKEGVDVILIGRGGGSFEDLMPFNDEALARAVRNCSVPVVSGIGHEPDTTIVDMVSDFRASTPTAAAEAISPAPEELVRTLQEKGESLRNSLVLRINRSKDYLAALKSRPVLMSPYSLLQTQAMLLDAVHDKFALSAKHVFDPYKNSLGATHATLKNFGESALIKPKHMIAQQAGKLDALSPLKVLGRGYAIAKDEKGTIVKTVKDVQISQDLCVVLSDGEIQCEVKKVDEISLGFENIGGQK